MSLNLRRCQTLDDFFRVRNFLREVFLQNNRLELSWHVARLDYWRWHFIATCGSTLPFEQVTTAWETSQGEFAALVHPIGGGEIRIHIDPCRRTPELEAEIFTYAASHYAEEGGNGPRIIVPVFADDTLRQQTLAGLGFLNSQVGIITIGVIWPGLFQSLLFLMDMRFAPWAQRMSIPAAVGVRGAPFTLTNRFRITTGIFPGIGISNRRRFIGATWML